MAKAASNKLKAHKNTGFVAKAVLDWLKAHKNTEICGKKPLKVVPSATNAAGNGAKGADGWTFGDENCKNLPESAGAEACYARQDAGIGVYQLIVRVYTLPNRSLTDTVPEPVAGACTLNSV